ncbi:MAG: sigma-70 family RNA polymerase sigma factor [Sedimentisphaerales bacterium]|nr:sigma-70 family RNA polymerase sigma factor [Sedimentisphaerales bacterium]MBN2844243.1 sigma-70 family RNA polymerase sigma factor [Sedimentisphaerales bacterium]
MLTKAEQILLEGIKAGDAEIWQQLLDRYQGRLYSYALRMLNGRSADAEDVVQDVFISFLKNLSSFEGRSSLESWLFLILRRRIIDMFRRKKADISCLVNDLISEDSDSGELLTNGGLIEKMTASGYARNSECKERLSAMLADALSELTDRLKSGRNFRDLKVIELIFYAGQGNKQVAEILALDANSVAVIRHRFIEKLKGMLSDNSELPEGGSIDGLLSETWVEGRFTCPKRSTIGSWLLGTLDEDWSAYVDFHLNTVGCAICRANLDDLESTIKQKQQENVLRQKIFESSIGFLT